MRNWSIRNKRRFLDWWKKYFSFTYPEPLQTEPANAGKSENFLDNAIREAREEIYGRMREFRSKTSMDVEDDKINDSLNNFVRNEEELIYLSGFEDGIRGTRNVSIADKIKSRIFFIVEHAASIISGMLQGLKAQEKNVNERILKHANTEKELGLVYDQLLQIRREKPIHFSWFLTFIYWVAAVVLMVADFPISVSIAENFVRLSPEMAVAPFSHCIWSPEILLFSLGITLLSLYFKIIYDEYFNPPLVKQIKPTSTVNVLSVFQILFQISVTIFSGLHTG